MGVSGDVWSLTSRGCENCLAACYYFFFFFELNRHYMHLLLSKCPNNSQNEYKYTAIFGQWVICIVGDRFDKLTCAKN